MMTPLEVACDIQRQLILALRRVRATCPGWWSEAQVQEAQGRDLECISLKAEADLAWQRLGGKA